MELLYFVGKIHILTFLLWLCSFLVCTRYSPFFRWILCYVCRCWCCCCCCLWLCVCIFRCKRTCLHCTITANEQEKESHFCGCMLYGWWWWWYCSVAADADAAVLAFRPHLIINASKETSNRPGKFLIAVYCHWHSLGFFDRTTEKLF